MKNNKKNEEKNEEKKKAILEILTLPEGTKIYETSVDKIMEEIRYGKYTQQA